MKTAVIIQARMTSTRLPGKVLLPLGGEPMLARLLDRMARLTCADGVIVATTVLATDDPVARLCAERGVACHRGSEQDVLSRYADAARSQGAETVVRITSDCPLLDPALVDQAIAGYRAGGCDYLTNMQPPTWPYGMAVEVFSAQALYQAHAEATDPGEREHVTPFLYWRPERYRMRNLASPRDLSAYRLTVDTPEDYAVVSRVFDAALALRPDFTLDDVLGICDAHPDWLDINQHVVQKQVRPDLQTSH